jgi:hypothetical protein
VRDEAREIRDAHIFSETDIQVLIAVVVLENENAGVGEVLDVEKFAPGRSGSPYRHRKTFGLLGFMKAADEGRDDVTMIGVIIIAGAIEIGRHDRNVAAAILATVGLGQLQARDLGDRIPLVGGFQGTRHQRIFAQRLWRVARVDAG